MLILCVKGTLKTKKSIENINKVIVVLKANGFSMNGKKSHDEAIKNKKGFIEFIVDILILCILTN